MTDAVQVVGGAALVDEPEVWPTVVTETLGTGAITTFVQDTVLTPDERPLLRQYLQHPGAVGIIALDADDRVVLVRQYRHPVRHRLLEPPAGLLDVDGEDYLAAAQRELAEEAGIAAEDWHVLVDLFSSPGMADESLRIYLARGLSEVGAPDGFVKHGEEAHMTVVRADLDEVVDGVLAGRLHNPILVSGALAAWTARSRSWSGLRAPDAPWPARDASRT